jgi:hypothetical protein
MEKQKIVNEGLKDFQEVNCRECNFADKEKVGTGEPCCTYAFQLECSGGICRTRRERR